MVISPGQEGKAIGVKVHLHREAGGGKLVVRAEPAIPESGIQRDVLQGKKAEAGFRHQGDVRGTGRTEAAHLFAAEDQTRADPQVGVQPAGTAESEKKP